MFEALLRYLAEQGRKILPLRLGLRLNSTAAARPAAESRRRTVFEAAVAALGAIDVLVNNAAPPLQQPAIDAAWAEWDDVIAINLKGAYFLGRQLAAHCITRGRPGGLINMASTHGITSLADRSVYGISKSGLIQMCRMLAIEWTPYNIRVNLVPSETVLTESRQHLLHQTARGKLFARIPSRCFVTPKQVAAGVCFLAGPEADSIAGQTLPVGWGLTAI